MNPVPLHRVLNPWLFGCTCVSLAGVALSAAEAPAAGPTPTLTPKASLGFRIGYDSNVYLQDVEPGPAGAAEAEAAGLEVARSHQGSLVTTVLPQFSLRYTPGPALTANLSYAPEWTTFTDEPSENHTVHRGTVNLNGRLGDLNWELPNTFVYIDGPTLGPAFGRPGDVPAVGGIPLRDRREALVFKNSFKVSYRLGKWLLRPTATAYVHDFQTDQIRSGTNFIYENYIDRSEVTGGLDVGLEVADKTTILLGYRFGSQEQKALLGVDSPYDNYLHRILLGLEGSPWPWLKAAVSFGPDLRDFHDNRLSTVAPAFDDEEFLIYADATLTFIPTANDTLMLFHRRYEQPAFGSPSMYEDITYDLTWRHRWHAHWSSSAGFRIYAGDWQGPVNRDDWIYTPSIGVSWTPLAKVSADLAYSYDWVDSQVPNTEGREFTRHLVSLNLKYEF